MNDLFENGNYNNNFVDVLVNVCGKYFGLDFSVSVFFTTKLRLILIFCTLKSQKDLSLIKINSLFIPKAWYDLNVIFCSL